MTTEGDGGCPVDARRRRRPNLLKKTTGFCLGSRASRRTRRTPDGPDDDDDAIDLHALFRASDSLTELRDEFRAALKDEADKNVGFGANAPARPEGGTGRLLLHSIGLNSNLIAGGRRGAAAARCRANRFVLQELLAAYPPAIVEADDEGHIPFVEPIVLWIEARRAVRRWKADTDRTRRTVARVADKLGQRRVDVSVATKTGEHAGEHRQSSDPLSSSSCSRMSSFKSLILGSGDESQGLAELKGIVESADDAVFCIDQVGIIFLTNEAAVRQFGYAKKELIGANISLIMNAKEAAKHGEHLERYLKTKVKRVMGLKRELHARRKDGSTFLIEIGLAEAHIGEKLVFAGFIKDLSKLENHRQTLAVNGSYEDEDDVEVSDEDGLHDAATRSALMSRRVPPLVEWCFDVLSEFVNGYRLHGSEDVGYGAGHDSFSDGSSGLESESPNNKGSHQTTPAMYDAVVVEKVASIPHLVEELLLVENLQVRRRIFDTSIMRKALFNVKSLGDGRWLPRMLERGIHVAKHQRLVDTNLTGFDADTADCRRFQMQQTMDQDKCRFLAEGAVMYLQRISELTIQDDVHFHQHENGPNAIAQRDITMFRKRQNALFDAIGGQAGLVRLISALDDDLVKRAASTLVVRKLLDRIMFSPFATSAALFDGINHLLLLISFRMGPAPALFYLLDNGVFWPQRYLCFSAALIASVAYFGTKAIHQNLAKYTLSETFFWSDTFTLWSELDLIPLLMVAYCSVAVDLVLKERLHNEISCDDVPYSLRTAIAITTSFLWLRILAFMKVRNEELATFILCTVEILRDIRWFLLVFFAAIGAFAQMWASLTYEPVLSGDLNYMQVYYQAYTTVLGDIESDALRRHPLATFVFVIYTFGGTIVMLNILIAIVGSSYKKTFDSSRTMLGKARLLFVSELLSLKQFNKLMEGREAWNNASEPSVSGVHLKAMLAFAVLFSMLVFVKATLNYISIGFDDIGRFESSLEDVSSSFAERLMQSFVKQIFRALSSTFDSLFDKEDAQIELDRPSDKTSKEEAIHRAIVKMEAHLKAEAREALAQAKLELSSVEFAKKRQMLKVIESANASAIAEALQMMMQDQQLEPGEEQEGEVQEHLLGEEQ
ncbi:hypothetical protein ACHAXT_007694, partial [Thalassiosira profunda]